MKKFINKGFFIVFEGIEGSGKTTQINYLYEELQARKFNVIRTREPGGTQNAETIRDLVLDKNIPPFEKITETLLLTAARREHVKKIIEPALKNNSIVICDRFVDSTLAYQGNGLGVNKDTINTLNNIAIGCTKPDLTVLLDLDPKIGLRRASKRAELDKFEEYNQKFHEIIRKSYLDLASEHPEKYIIIDANKEEIILKNSIIDLVFSRLV